MSVENLCVVNQRGMSQLILKIYACCGDAAKPLVEQLAIAVECMQIGVENPHAIFMALAKPENWAHLESGGSRHEVSVWNQWATGRSQGQRREHLRTVESEQLKLRISLENLLLKLGFNVVEVETMKQLIEEKDHDAAEEQRRQNARNKEKADAAVQKQVNKAIEEQNKLKRLRESNPSFIVRQKLNKVGRIIPLLEPHPDQQKSEEKKHEDPLPTPVQESSLPVPVQNSPPVQKAAPRQMSTTRAEKQELMQKLAKAGSLFNVLANREAAMQREEAGSDSDLADGMANTALEG